MEHTEEAQYQKMTATPVSKLILRLGLPTTISMLVTNLYNMADTWFVSSLGLSATGAVGVVFGLMAIIQAFGFTFGHGAGSNISRLLGARNREQARRFSSTAFYLALAVGALITVFGLLFLTPLCKLLGSSSSILPYAKTYAVFILLSAPAMAASCVMNNILRYEGRASEAMVGLVSGSVLNIGGDALFIFVLHMDIAGAGLSTMLSQYVSFAILLWFFIRGKAQTSLAPRYFTRSASLIWDMVKTGFPSMIRQGLTSVSTMVLNWQAMIYGDAAIAAMSVISRIFNFLYSVALGIGQGFQPVSSFNYGAKKYDRVRKAFLFTLAFGTLTMLCFTVGGLLLGDPLVALFLDDPQALEIARYVLRLQCFTMLTVPVCICGNMLFQSIGLAGRASFLACLRSGMVFIPTLLFLAQLFHLRGIEWAQSVTDLLSMLITLPFLLHFLHKVNGMSEKQAADDSIDTRNR